MKKRFFALFLTMALLLPAVLLSGCASADSGIMDTANLNATAAGGDSSLPVVTWKIVALQTSCENFSNNLQKRNGA